MLNRGTAFYCLPCSIKLEDLYFSPLKIEDIKTREDLKNFSGYTSNSFIYLKVFKRSYFGREVLCVNEGSFLEELAHYFTRDLPIQKGYDHIWKLIKPISVNKKRDDYLIHHVLMFHICLATGESKFASLKRWYLTLLTGKEFFDATRSFEILKEKKIIFKKPTEVERLKIHNYKNPAFLNLSRPFSLPFYNTF